MDSKIEAELRASLRRTIASCPFDYRGRLAAFAMMRHVFHQEVAAALQPGFNDHLCNTEHADAESKRNLCSQANSELRSLGLAIRCPRTGRPAILVTDARTASDDRGRFRLELRDESGRIVRTLSSRTLPDRIQLVEAPIRTEPFARAFRER